MLDNILKLPSDEAQSGVNAALKIDDKINQNGGEANCSEKNDIKKGANYKNYIPPNIINIELVQEKNFIKEDILEKNFKENIADESSFSTPITNDLNTPVDTSSPIRRHDSNLE